jgi:hypothetical protein
VASAETAKFVLAGFDPEGPFTALAEFEVFSQLTSVRVEGIAMESIVVGKGGRGRGWDGGGSVGSVLGVGVGTMGVAGD